METSILNGMVVVIWPTLAPFTEFEDAKNKITGGVIQYESFSRKQQSPGLT